MNIRVPDVEQVKETTYSEECPRCGEIKNELDNIVLEPSALYQKPKGRGIGSSIKNKSTHDISDLAVTYSERALKSIKLFFAGEIRLCKDCMDDLFVSEDEAFERNRF